MVTIACSLLTKNLDSGDFVPCGAATAILVPHCCRKLLTPCICLTRRIQPRERHTASEQWLQVNIAIHWGEVIGVLEQPFQDERTLCLDSIDIKDM